MIRKLSKRNINVTLQGLMCKDVFPKPVCKTKKASVASEDYRCEWRWPCLLSYLSVMDEAVPLDPTLCLRHFTWKNSRLLAHLQSMAGRAMSRMHTGQIKMNVIVPFLQVTGIYQTTMTLTYYIYSRVTYTYTTTQHKINETK